MSHEDHLIQLDNFGHEVVGLLEVHLFQFDINALVHVLVVYFGNDHPWEQIGSDTLEKRQVKCQKFSQIDVVDSPQHKDRLIFVRELSLEVAGSSDDRLHGTHTVVIMVLRRQLLRAERVGRRNFSGEVSGIIEAEGIERDFSNHGVIWHHHSDSPEQRLQVIWQFRTTSITGVHRDEHIAGLLQGDFRILEKENLLALFSSDSDSEDLLGDHGEHFKIDTVELVEAGPRTR